MKFWLDLPYTVLLFETCEELTSKKLEGT